MDIPTITTLMYGDNLSKFLMSVMGHCVEQYELNPQSWHWSNALFKIKGVQSWLSWNKQLDYSSAVAFLRFAGWYEYAARDANYARQVCAIYRQAEQSVYGDKHGL